MHSERPATQKCAQSSAVAWERVKPQRLHHTDFSRENEGRGWGAGRGRSALGMGTAHRWGG